MFFSSFIVEMLHVVVEDQVYIWLHFLVAVAAQNDLLKSVVVIFYVC